MTPRSRPGPERHVPPVVIARVAPMPDGPVVVPAAVQSPGAGQDTPSNSVCMVPAGAGTGSSRQRVPFQVSAKAPKGLKSRAASMPTAVHADGAVQETVLSWLRPWGIGLGLGRTRQAVPFHVSASVGEAVGHGEVIADRGARAGGGTGHPVERLSLRAGRRGHGHVPPGCAVPDLGALADGHTRGRRGARHPGRTAPAPAGSGGPGCASGCRSRSRPRSPCGRAG